jgi:phospholipase D1/2
MAGKPFQTSAFATSLRRQLFRKHLGLIKPQDFTRPDANFEPVGVPNAYDWGSPEDLVVSDPLSPTFDALWNSRARTNTEVFRKVFRCVPDDNVTSWAEYKEFFEYFFHGADSVAEGNYKPTQGKRPPRYEWGHIVREDFPPGPEGIRQVKDLLSQVKGTLVEMPLMFLANEDIAKEGLKLNPMTVEVYT